MAQKHYYYFGKDLQKSLSGKSINERNWDTLRTADVASPFTLEKDIASYEENCLRSDTYRQTADAILKEINNLGISTHIISFGVGKAILEWHLKNLMPNIFIECTDYTPDTISALKLVFPKMDSIYTFDMLKGKYDCFNSDATFLMHRLSTEFNKNQWKQIFSNLYSSNITNIVFIPVGLNNPKAMIREYLRHIKHILLGHKDIFCGWLYTESELLSIFAGDTNQPLYTVQNKISLSSGNVIYFLKKNP